MSTLGNFLSKMYLLHCLCIFWCCIGVFWIFLMFCFALLDHNFYYYTKLTFISVYFHVVVFHFALILHFLPCKGIQQSSSFFIQQTLHNNKLMFSSTFSLDFPWVNATIATCTKPLFPFSVHGITIHQFLLETIGWNITYSQCSRRTMVWLEMLTIHYICQLLQLHSGTLSSWNQL